ncbi:zinc finger HIT domain-containing protein 1 [Drosophila subpulchrella]|uniref:zinc finger HIT domain-containing protein 1 n=1 Tax=Drosophila subpulchrella TaxID=1486046 RepID=UPI0018A1AF70|nr:zinc finger HIT domain-containing protein 1 [Drosophila subpulchrella]
MTGRESNRIKDAEKKRVLDSTARQRRARKALEALEQDNFHDDPHADLVMSKKLPKFQDNLKTGKEKKGKRKGAEYFRAKYRKNFQQLLEEDKDKRPNYESASAPPPQKPVRHFCAVCGNFSLYSCTACGTRYCRVRCLQTHQDTRCLKWTV